MGLPRRRHKIKLGMPDYLGIVLLIVCMTLSIYSYSELAQMNWTRTTAKVIGVSTTNKSKAIKSSELDYSASGMSVHYRYDTGMQIHTGTWQSNWLNKPILNRAAPGLVNSISQANVANTIDASTIVTPTSGKVQTQAVPAGLPQDISSADINRSLRGRDFDAVAADRRRSLGSISPEMVAIEQVTTLMPQATPDMQSRAAKIIGSNSAAIQHAMELKIRYDPANPKNSALDYPGFNLHVPTVLMDIAMLILLIRYFSVTYPRLKMIGY
jgi:hypothetical protein